MNNPRLACAVKWAKDRERRMLLSARTIEDDAECGSYVYFIQSGPYVKIGIADRPKHRLSMLQVGNPITLVILNTFKVIRANQVERSLHEHFNDKWQRGEWFRLSDDDVVRIQTARTILDVITGGGMNA